MSVNYSPSRQTNTLTSQQKDLLITHLKSEVYELKQQDRDYKNLESQVRQLQARLQYLIEERDYAMKDYQSKILGQEKQVQSLNKEKTELDRLIANKDKENDDMKTKIAKYKDRSGTVEDDYTSSREMNDNLMQKNQQLKNEIVELEDLIQAEKDRQFELRAIKDKANHNVYKAFADSEENKMKEQELMRKLNSQNGQQKQLEDKLRSLEKQCDEKDKKVNKINGEILDEKQLLNKLKELQNQLQASVNQLEEENKKLKQVLQMENARGEEHQQRLRELDEKLKRRDEEGWTMGNQINEIEEQNFHLRQKYDLLFQEREALEKYMKQLNQVNLDIEKELDNFVSIDDSVCKQLERRDEKYSPVRSSFQFQQSQQNVQPSQSFYQQQQPNPVRSYENDNWKNKSIGQPLGNSGPGLGASTSSQYATFEPKVQMFGSYKKQNEFQSPNDFNLSNNKTNIQNQNSSYSSQYPFQNSQSQKQVYQQNQQPFSQQVQNFQSPSDLQNSQSQMKFLNPKQLNDQQYRNDQDSRRYQRREEDQRQDDQIKKPPSSPLRYKR